MQTEKKTIKHKRHKPFFRGLVFLLFVVSIFSIGVIYFLDMVPLVYFIGIVLLFLLVDFFMVYCILGRGWKKRFFGTIFSILFMIVQVIVDVYVLQTMDFLHKINNNGNYNTENYSVLVLQDSSYHKLKDLKEEILGVATLGDDVGLVEAKKHLSKKIEVNYKEEEDLSSLYQLLLEKRVAALLVEDAEKSILEEEFSEFKGKVEVLYTFSIDIEIKDDLVKSVDITNAPFNIFISGIDSYGKITSVSRSDVNMVVSVNPVTHKVLFTSIPRDYYVALHGMNSSYKDKLTHAGMHGIDTSVKTVEDLLGIDINYYAKVNFTSLVSLVDELGGIDIELDKPFRAYYDEDGKITNYSFKKGTNHLDGKKALAFVRERKSLPLGDRTRVKHQQMVMEGILHKVLSKSIITKYADILNVLEGKFVTNFGTQNISKLVKKQVKDNPDWEINSYVLTGEDGKEYTYSYKRLKSYVMNPREDSVNEAKNLIQNLFQEVPSE